MLSALTHPVTARSGKFPNLRQTSRAVWDGLNDQAAKGVLMPSVITKTTSMEVGEDQNTVDRVIETVLERNEKVLPYVKRLAENRSIPMGQLAAWLLYETRPDVGTYPKVQPQKWRFFLERARFVSYVCSQRHQSKEWTRNELHRWARIGQWSQDISDATIADIQDEKTYGSIWGFGRDAPFLFLWVASSEISAFLEKGEAPSWKPTKDNDEYVWSALLDCLSSRLFRIPIERLSQFRLDLISWLGFDDDGIKRWDHLISGTIYRNHGSSAYSTDQLQEMTLWSHEAAAELAKRRIPLDDPNGPHADGWVSKMLSRIPKYQDWCDALAEYANASPVRKRAIWDNHHSDRIVDPRHPFADTEIALKELMGDEPEMPTYAETLAFFGMA